MLSHLFSGLSHQEELAASLGCSLSDLGLHALHLVLPSSLLVANKLVYFADNCFVVSHRFLLDGLQLLLPGTLCSCKFSVKHDRVEGLSPFD